MPDSPEARARRNIDQLSKFSHRLTYREARAATFLALYICCLFSPFIPSTCAQDDQRSSVWKPPELEAADPEIRSLLDTTAAACDQFNINDVIERAQKALSIADSRGLVGDRALANRKSTRLNSSHV